MSPCRCGAGSPAGMTSRSRWRGAPAGGTSGRSWPGPTSRRTWPSRLTPPSPGAASGTPRQDRLAAPAGAAGRGSAAGVLDSGIPHPGMSGAAGDLPRLPGRAHRLGAAHTRGVLPPGRPGPGRGRAAHRPRPTGAARGRRLQPVTGRAAAGGHRAGRAGRAGGPPGRAASRAAGCRTAPHRGEGAGGAAVWGSGRSPRWR